MKNLSIRIENLLNRPMHFLMYRGGAGGEFLLTKIYQYSKKYSTTANNCVSQNHNKTYIKYPNFFLNLITVNPKGPTILQNLLSVSNEADITEAENHLNNISNFPLFKLHYLDNTYFRKKSFFVALDNINWFEYAGLLITLKNRTDIDNINRVIDWVSKNFNKNPMTEEDKFYIVNRIKSFMLKNEVTELSNLHIIVASRDSTIVTNSVEEVLSCPFNILYEKYYDRYFGSYSNYKQTLAYDFLKVIKYSNYFDKGYLEDIFEIDSNNFHYELLEWHENNLELLSNNGFDSSKFKLTY